MARIVMLAVCACLLAAVLLAPSGVGLPSAAAQETTPAVEAAPAAEPAPRRYRVAYQRWRGRLKRHQVHVGRNLLAAPSGEARAADDASPATKRELRRSIHRMQRRWGRWLRHDLQGRAVAFQLKVRRQVPSWGKAHLRSIAWCESKNNPRAIGGGGAYRGMYQFSFSTWAVVGGSGDPAAASRWEQTWRAWLLLSRHGSGHWPVCG
jgi:Transglycosylase-like domain